VNSNTTSISEARRIALHAQGFTGQSRDTKATWPKMAAMIEKLHLLQIDSVNVLVRSHYLPLYARLGHYDVAALDARCFTQAKRHFFECWAHEASFVPMNLHPLMRWRMDRARAGNGTYKSMNKYGLENKPYLKATLEHIQRNGPIRSSEVPDGGKSDGGWWGWSKGKMALETLFDQGLITAATRQGFERIYDLPERVLPSDVLNRPTPSERDSFRVLIEKSAEALGIATEFDLRDYFRLPVAEARQATLDNIEAGVISPVSVEGWTKQAYMHRDAKIPRKAGATALLSPFDPIVWDRDRAERLFNFHYRIELYTPAPKRKFGYYVLPFMTGETLGGRLCLKSDRENGTLLVNRSHVEDGANPGDVAPAIAAEIKLMAQWLGLPNVKIARTGNFAKALNAASRDNAR
jgi:uncharacterized protein YcaQ